MLAAALLFAAADGATLGDQAFVAFESVCLKHRQVGLDATRVALTEVGAERLADLPPLGGSRPLEVSKAGDIEFLLRPDGKSYGCFVAFAANSANDAEVALARLSAMPGLVSKTVKPSKKIYYEWTFGDGSKDSVRLTPDTQQGVLINLEVGRK